MKSALLEIGVETLPARFLKPALEQLQGKAQALLKASRLSHGALRTYGTPMRLALLIEDLAEKSTSETLEVSGPPARLLKDAAGAFTKQAAGFARKQGIRPEELETASLPKGEFLMARKTLPGESAPKLLKTLFPELIASLEFPKGLVWEESRFRFARPIRTLLALYGKKTIPFSLAGVRSGNKTRGLAALGAQAFAVSSPAAYAGMLKERCVLADMRERGKALRRTLDAAAKRTRGALDNDDELFETQLCMTEHPVAVVGSFKEEYLELPQELLTMVLKKQLMFFPVRKPDGSLAPDFVAVRDGVSEGQKQVRNGFERVLDARFSDARFFFRRDRKVPLAERAKGLDRVRFQKGLGSMAQKTARVQELSNWLFMRLLQDHELDRGAVAGAAKLVYADLVTGVVGEFPELQGVMAGVYARHEGLGEKLAMSLSEFYFPAAAKAPLPTTIEACIVSLAGKLDTAAAMFAAGFKPSGSEDPFGLRRQGNGIIRILLEKQIRVPLPDAARKALELVAADGSEKDFDVRTAADELLEFFWQRVETLFLERGYKVDELRAVRSGGLDSLVRTFQRLIAVHALRPEPDFVPLAQAFKRASNIIRQAEFSEDAEVDKELFTDAPEGELFSALCRIESEVREKVDQGLYEEGLRSLVSLKPQVDRFFDEVLVMAEKEDVKRNRLSLLSRLVRLFKSVADISHIQN